MSETCDVFAGIVADFGDVPSFEDAQAEKERRFVAALARIEKLLPEHGIAIAGLEGEDFEFAQDNITLLAVSLLEAEGEASEEYVATATMLTQAFLLARGAAPEWATLAGAILPGPDLGDDPDGLVQKYRAKFEQDERDFSDQVQQNVEWLAQQLRINGHDGELYNDRAVWHVARALIEGPVGKDDIRELLSGFEVDLGSGPWAILVADLDLPESVDQPE